MAISKQYLLYHISNYFFDRLENYKGKTINGWGDYRDNNARCALGSLVRKEQNKWFSIRTEVEKLIQKGPFSSWATDGFLGRIVAFNDRYVAGSKHTLTAQGVRRFLITLATDYGLAYPSESNKKWNRWEESAYSPFLKEIDDAYNCDHLC